MSRAQVPLFGRLEPPQLRHLTAELRKLQRRQYTGLVSLNVHGVLCMPLPASSDYYGAEHVPPAGTPFDPVRAARRLIAALKAGELAT